MGRRRRRPSSRRRRSFGRRKRSPETVFWIVLVSFLVLGGSGFFAHSTLSNLIGRVSGEEAVTSSLEEAENKAEETGESELIWEPKTPEDRKNILLLGLDDKGFSDMVMVLSYDLETFESSLFSIKRDTYISDHDWAEKNSGQCHLAWASNRGMGRDEDYDRGCRLAAKTVEELLEIDLHAFAGVTMEGFVDIIDLLGGVEIEVAPQFAERESNPLPTGLQRLDGEQTLIYARHRQNPRIPEPGSTSQDGDRVRRNQQLVKAMFNQAKSMESEELMKLIDRVDEKLYTSLDDWDIVDLLNLLYHRDLDEMETAVIPGEGKLVFEERIEGDVYYFYPDPEETAEILGRLNIR